MSLHAVGNSDKSDPLSQCLTEITFSFLIKVSQSSRISGDIFGRTLNLPSPHIASIVIKALFICYKLL